MDSIQKLQNRLSAEWTSINEAKSRTDEIMKILSEVANECPPFRQDIDMVVFGSVARGEFTHGSDIDWTLLIDGSTSKDDLSVAMSIKEELKNSGMESPNVEGAFGSLVFAPSLVHEIGGHNDTNKNTTQRILLLLESSSITKNGVRQRVIEQVLRRYLEEDTPFPAQRLHGVTPRFLLNDIVRFWRTMAVDFANKRRSEGNKGWALRNAKLRMSRKLIFVAGLIMCYRFQKTSLDDYEKAVFQIQADVEMSPLCLIACFLYDEEIDYNVVSTLFGCYNGFLSIISDESKRNHLKSLNYDQSKDDQIFQKVRELGEDFQQSLIKVFFDSNSAMTTWSHEYGVF